MIELLVASNLICKNFQDVINRIDLSHDLTNQQKTEIIEELKKNVPNCKLSKKKL